MNANENNTNNKAGKKKFIFIGVALALLLIIVAVVVIILTTKKEDKLAKLEGKWYSYNSETNEYTLAFEIKKFDDDNWEYVVDCDECSGIIEIDTDGALQIYDEDASYFYYTLDGDELYDYGYDETKTEEPYIYYRR